MTTGTVCCRQKTNICNVKFGFWGLCGGRGKNSSSGVPFVIAGPDLPISCATFVGLR